MDPLKTLITGDEFLHWLIIAILLGYWAYKEWPEFYRRITGHALEKAQDAAQDKSLNERLTAIEADVKQIKEKLTRDYDRINRMEAWKTTMSGVIKDSLEEREIIMEALLGVLGGLQEIGANGPTKTAEKRLSEYINRKAHEREENIG